MRVAIVLALSALTCVAAEKIDLQKEARIYASHATPGDEFKIENAIDGDPETKWVGEAHPLSFQPANIVIEFSKEEIVEGVSLRSIIFRDRLALKDFEVYARADEGWAGVLKAQATNLLTQVQFAAVRTKALRIRIRDTWREDHSYPRVHEIEVFRAASGGGRSLKASPILDEKGSERFVLRRALGEKYVPPGTTFDAAKGNLQYAREFIETMIREGTDRYGKVSSPMFASILDMETHRLPEDIPANIEGQRYGDRSLRGGNLHHDVMLLQACDLLSEMTGEEKYRRAKHDYLQFFLKNCPQAPGLFPWGEHAYWDFFDEKPGADIHEFLGGIPDAFWESLWKLDSEKVKREADGLINHVTDLENFHFDRHAELNKALPTPRARGGGGLDFPRHAGFYIHVWGFVFAKTQEQRYADWIVKMIEHHWRFRDVDGILPSTTRGAQAQIATVESTLSLGLSLLETAEILPDGDLKKRCQAAGESYGMAAVRLLHQPAEGKFIATLDMKSRKPDFSEPYRFGYGGGFTADNANLLLALYRIRKDQRAFALADGFADFYAKHEPPPGHEIVRAHVYASIIGLFTDLYALTGKPAYREQADRYAKLAIERLFYKGLFRGATGVDHYESDLMPGNLAYNLLWLESVKRDPKSKVAPNYFNR
jgi:hypothetical protein